MFVYDHRNEFHIKQMCNVLDLTRSGYYAYVKQPLSTAEISNKELLEKIRVVFEQSNRRYGCLRITAELYSQGIRCSKNRVAKLMKKHGIKVKMRRKYKKTTDSNHRLPVAENLVKMRFNPDKANRLWTTDITYIWTKEGWLYLTVVLDLWSRMVISWKADEQMDESLVSNALSKAISIRKPSEGLIVHSDRGSQYAGMKIREMMYRSNLRQSMSSKGNCYDNAPTESFFSTLKRELIYREYYRTREEAKRSLFEYIEIFYNRQRRHSTLGYLSPMQFENLNNQP
jgi:transposase InsO family protein